MVPIPLFNLDDCDNVLRLLEIWEGAVGYRLLFSIPVWATFFIIFVSRAEAVSFRDSSLEPAVSSLILRVQQQVTEPKLKAVIASLQNNTLDLNQLEPILRIAVENQMPAVRQRLNALGPLQGMKFMGVQQGSDVYQVTFANGVTAWAIQMSPNGKLSALWFN